MKWIIVCIVAVMACSCKREQGKSIKNWQELTVDIKTDCSTEAVFSDVRFIKLETTEQSLLGKVGKVVMHDERLFILSSIGGTENNVMAFDKTGHFLFKLKRGRGPGEINFASDINVNRKKKELWVLDLYQQMKIFDLQGNYLRSFVVDEPALYFEPEGEQVVFFDSDMDRNSDYYAWTWVEGKRTKTFFPKIKHLSSANLIHAYPFARMGEDSLLVADYFSDTIYCVSNGGKEVNIHYVMNYKGRSMNEPERIKRVKDRKSYRDMLKIQNTVSGILDLAVSKQRLFFMLESDRPYYVMYDRASGKASLHSRLFEGLPNSYGAVGRNAEYVFYSMTVSRLVNYFEENPASASDPEGVKRLRQECGNEEDNPIIFLCNYNR